ncbi:MAG: hypothetical protein HW387_529 [Parachlamydiales bacterium]|nr:hypothetical protein [Parachlamydiales bacterium]
MTTAPFPAAPDSFCCPLSQYFCSDWTQVIGDIGCLGATALSVFGCFSSNIPMAVVSGVAAASNAALVLRVGYLRPMSELDHSVDQLDQTIADLRADNAAKAEEAHHLHESAKILEGTIEQIRQENDELYLKRQQDVKQLSEVTQELDRLQQRYRTIQETCLNLQRTLSSACATETSALESASNAMQANEDQFAKALPSLTKGVTSLQTYVVSAKKENADLRGLLEQLQSEKIALDKRIKSLQTEKADLQKLVTAQQSEADLQRKIEEQTRKLTEVETRLAQLAPKLREVLNALPAPGSAIKKQPDK